MSSFIYVVACDSIFFLSRLDNILFYSILSLSLSIYIHTHIHTHTQELVFPGGSDSKESACNARDPGSIPGLGRSPGEGNGYPLQYSCPEKPMDRGAW